MARRGNRRAGGAGPLIGVAVLTALISAGVTIVVTDQRGGAVAGLASDISGAVGGVLMTPVRWGESVVSSVGSFFGGAGLNQKLKEENRALLQWRDQAKAMAERLDAYEKLHGVKAEQLPQGLTGRLISESSGPFAKSGIVNLGAKAGVKVNWIVMNQNGLVGRVIAVGSDTSRVLFLADGDSRVPVMGETTRARAIAMGDKTSAPRLAHLNTPTLMRDGERVMTSGDDGIFPRGIAVGQAGVAPDRQWRVRLASSASPIDFVRLVPPSNFPPPLDPVTAPSLAPPPTEGLATAPVQGGVLPLAADAAGVPTAATPEAIRAAQALRGSEIEAARAAAARLAKERDAAREQARLAEAARLAAESRNVPVAGSASGSAAPPSPALQTAPAVAPPAAPPPSGAPKQ
ncbi:MAG: rod shape-determining protein MreC [Hyphomonadaceae bacterium]|jgi:rod shape-determining protein MreC|uniref:rod shape-determining protein MreC n=1 Tax=Aquidulcibacter sp. TaxID=2052990 RepID=UPI0022C7B7D3|nr:rod shape-determining protein MreC [Aquidulcibacter sp.]MCE2891583.1 rod shape-determining protein MreC [Hyphomonadaceae bacterium]MCZ8209680.1 rod shape-determining protein MreC [Aquidulcibacter sp.]